MSLSRIQNPDAVEREAINTVELNVDVFFIILSKVSNLFLLRLVCKNWQNLIEDFKGASLNISLNQLKNYFDTPSQRQPLNWTFDLLSFLPSQRKYTLYPHLSFDEFKKLKKEIASLKGKGNTLVAYTQLEFSELEIQKLANKSIKKARKNKDLIAISDKLAVFPFLGDQWVSKNLLNLLLYALTHRNQGRIILKIIELSLSSQHLILGKAQFELYLNNMAPITEEDFPKLFYMLMTTNQMNALELDCFKRVFLELSKKEDGIRDEFIQVYQSLAITKNDRMTLEKAGANDYPTRRMKIWTRDYFLNWPCYTNYFKGGHQDFSFCKMNGFQIHGNYNVNFNFSYAEIKGAQFFNSKEYTQNFSISLFRTTKGLRFFDFSHADLRYSRFKTLLISESDFRFSNMQSSFFHQADCIACDFSFANFSNTSLLSFRAVDCDFTGVNFDLAENEIIKIQLSACKNEYSKDWFVFLERDKGYALCQEELNYALLLALRTAQNLSWFNDVEKMILKGIIKAVERYSNLNIKGVFLYFLELYPDLFSDRLKDFLNDLEVGSRQFLRSSNGLSEATCVTLAVQSMKIFLSLPDFIPKPKEESQSTDFLMAKFLKYFSEPLAEIINKKGKFPTEIASCLHPEFKMQEKFLAIVRKHAEAVLVYALFHPKHAKVCLAILNKAFESSRIIFEKIQMTSDDMPKEVAVMWMVQALDDKIVLLSKIPFYQKAFESFAKQFPIKEKTFIFESYAKLYSVLHQPKTDNRWLNPLEYTGAVFSAFSGYLRNYITLPCICVSGIAKNKDFSRWNMSLVCFKKANFHKVDFSNSDLTNTKWIDSQFKKCDFEGANLNGASSNYFNIWMFDRDIAIAGSISGWMDVRQANQAALFALYALSAWGFSKKEKQFLKTLIGAIEKDLNTLFTQHYATAQESPKLSGRLKEKLECVMDISQLKIIESELELEGSDLDLLYGWRHLQQGTEAVSYPNQEAVEMEGNQPITSAVSNSMYSSSQTFFPAFNQAQFVPQLAQSQAMNSQQAAASAPISSYALLFGVEPDDQALEVGDDYYEDPHGNYAAENQSENNMNVDAPLSSQLNGGAQNSEEQDGMDVDTDDNRNPNSSSIMTFSKRN